MDDEIIKTSHENITHLAANTLYFLRFHWVGIDNYYLLFYWCTHFINKKRDETDEQIAKIFSQYVQDRMKIEGSFHVWIDGQSYFLS